MDVDDTGWPAGPVPAGPAPLAAPPASPADRIAAAQRMLSIRPHWSDRAIAAATGLASGTVAVIRTKAGLTHATTRLGRDGRVRPVSSAAGRRAAGYYVRRNPDASLRDIAKAAGISVGTARDVRERIRRGEDPVLPRQRSAEYRDRPAAVPPAARPWTALAVLRKDPALRGVLIGRTLLSLISQHTVVFSDWRRLADAVPPHCAALIAATARECAQVWSRFADHLDRRHRERGQRA